MALEDAAEQVDTAITREGFKGLSFENTFGGVRSFLRRTYTKDLSDVDIAVTGIPFDQAVTNRPGTRLGPRAIRDASSLQSPDPPMAGASMFCLNLRSRITVIWPLIMPVSTSFRRCLRHILPRSLIRMRPA